MQVALGVEVQDGLAAGVWSDFVGVGEAAVPIVRHKGGILEKRRLGLISQVFEVVG